MAGVRNLDYIRSKYVRIYEALQDIIQRQSNIEQQTNASGQGQPSAPPAIQGLKVAAQNGHFQVAIQDGGPVYRDVHYYVEHADNPNFTNPHTIHLGHSRNHSIFLGNTKRYWRAYSSYASSPASPAVYHGSPVSPLAVEGGGSVGAPAFLESEGSGTGDAGVGLSGPGPVPFRSASGAAPPRGTQGRQAGSGPVSAGAVGLPENATPFGGVIPASTGPAPPGPSGGGITALTGDVTASGSGSVPATLAASGVAAGSYTNSDITVDAKGRVTAAANGTAPPSPATAVPLVESGAGAVGTATKYAREDHVHPANTTPATATPLVESGAGAVGTATKYAREDHVHPALAVPHGFGATFDGGGSALTVGLVAYQTVPHGGTITAWNILVDTGTCTVKVWKVARGTAIPASGNSINTSGVAISSGTAIHSTTLTDFTTTTVADGDLVAVYLSAVTGATKVSFLVEIG